VSNGIADNPGGATRVGFPQFFMTIDPEYRIPRSYNWNISYQREIGFDTTVDIAYVGTTGNYLSRERELNQLRTGTTFLPENQGVAVDALRPYKGFASIPMLEHSGRSEYNGVQLEVNRRYSAGFSFGFAYTFSKSMDGNSGPRDRFIDVFNQGLNWGKSSFDTRHVGVVNFVWDMPFFRNSGGLVRTLAGGWQVAGVTQFQTGTPFTVQRGDDYLGIGSTNDKPWNLNGDPELPKEFSHRDAAGRYTNDPSFFFVPTVGGQPWATRPANGTYPNQNRNSIDFHHPGFQNWNLAVFKRFAITESHNLQFRAEAFNFPNHPNWDNVDTNPTSATFGKVTNKTSERNLQLSLRYSF
jgi:hypothetical protein